MLLGPPILIAIALLIHNLDRVFFRPIGTPLQIPAWRVFGLAFIEFLGVLSVIWPGIGIVAAVLFSPQGHHGFFLYVWFPILFASANAALTLRNCLRGRATAGFIAVHRWGSWLLIAIVSLSYGLFGIAIK